MKIIRIGMDIAKSVFQLHGERLRAPLPVILEQVESGDNGLTMPMRHLMNELREDRVQFDPRVGQMDEKIAIEAKGNVAVKRLQQIPRSVERPELDRAIRT